MHALRCSLGYAVVCALAAYCFLSCAGRHRDLHSFPTRRSSDLPRRVVYDDQLAVRVDGGKRIRDGILPPLDRKSTRLNSSHLGISYAVFCLKKKRDERARVPGQDKPVADGCAAGLPTHVECLAT